LIANNTIINSARGIRFFDHTSRHGEPYCLYPGSGRATIINNIIWNCPISLELSDSSFGNSWAAVSYCDIANGQTSASVGANSTLIWGPGNINVDPQFVSIATTNYRLRATSPCIDAGTNAMTLNWSNWSASVLNDLDGVPRPLDGNGDGMSRYDIGAYEFLLPTADSNGDGIPDGWMWQYRLDPTDPNIGSGNPDSDAHDTLAEWVADTNPVDAGSTFRITQIQRAASHGGFIIRFLSSSSRVYTLYSADTLLSEASAWTPVAGEVDKPGNGGVMTVSDTAFEPRRFYRVGVELP
jgi:hypothetical protein